MLAARALPWLLLLLPACGGGGSGAVAPGGNAARLAAADLVLAPGAREARIEIALQGAPAGAALLQFTAVYDASRLGPPAGGAVAEPVQSLPTADAEEVEPGRLVVLCGDGRNRAPVTLRDGPLLRLRLQTRPPHGPGTTTVELRDLLLVDAAGNDLPMAPGPVPVRITLP